ncbi:MAG: hypothetical protein MZV64_09770 [Ignavibacteriales bacterium]|nr:hypothetical protein [Ignavibacteriales bacterium]
MEADVREIAGRESLSNAEKLTAILDMVLERCVREKRLLTVIFGYLDHMRRSGATRTSGSGAGPSGCAISCPPS